MSQERVTIRKMFNNCPKPNGWFGCFAKVRGSSYDIKLTGTTTLPLANAMVIDAELTQKPGYPNEYEATNIKLVTKTITGTIAYLATLPGVSRVVASRFVNICGEDAIDIAQQGFDAIKHYVGSELTDKQINAIVDGITQTTFTNQLQQFIPEIGQNKKLLTKIINHFTGRKIMDEIKKNPYCLLEISGITFATVDAIALRMGVNPFDTIRIGYGLVHVMHTQNNGDMYVNLSNDDEFRNLYCDLAALLKIQFEDPTDFRDYFMRVINSNNFDLYLEEYKGQYHLYKASLYADMQYVVNRIRHIMTENVLQFDDTVINQTLAQYEFQKGMILNKEQRAAIKNTLSNRMSIITGGPGRGKTTMIEALVFCWSALYGKSILLAPTGKAANKLKKSMSPPSREYSYKEPQTIDRAICTIKRDEEYAQRINHRYENPDNLSRTLIIVDESSMIDMQKAADILRAYDNARYCFVGDADQLPPIDAGTFFKDIIELTDKRTMNIPVSKLVKPLRNSGVILENAEKINNNDISLKYNINEMPFFATNSDDEQALDMILEQYNDEREDNPDITQIAMLCPMKRGAIGTDSLNMAIQDIICPENTIATKTYDSRRGQYVFSKKGYPIPNMFFGTKEKHTNIRVGDIVINTKNMPQIETICYSNNDYWNGEPLRREFGLCNGDCGRVIAYIPAQANVDVHDQVVISLFDERTITLDIVDGDADNIALGYALTVHKAQGSEYNTVIYVSPHRLTGLQTIGFSNKNLIYTAVTRAKKRVVILGSKESVNTCISNNAPIKNSTFIDRLLT